MIAMMSAVKALKDDIDTTTSAGARHTRYALAAAARKARSSRYVATAVHNVTLPRPPQTLTMLYSHVVLRLPAAVNIRA